MANDQTDPVSGLTDSPHLSDHSSSNKDSMGVPLSEGRTGGNGAAGASRSLASATHTSPSLLPLSGNGVFAPTEVLSEDEGEGMHGGGLRSSGATARKGRTGNSLHGQDHNNNDDDDKEDDDDKAGDSHVMLGGRRILQGHEPRHPQTGEIIDAYDPRRPNEFQSVLMERARLRERRKAEERMQKEGGGQPHDDQTALKAASITKAQSAEEAYQLRLRLTQEVRSHQHSF